MTSVASRINPNASPYKLVEFQYDALNQQIARLVHNDGNGGTPDEERYFIYEGGQIVLEFEGDTAADLSHRYLWGPNVDQILADEQVLEDKLLWPLTDHLGSVRDIVQRKVVNGIEQPRVVQHRQYDAFGNLRGDLNHDGRIGVEDIDLLLQAIDPTPGAGNHKLTDSFFDLNGDGDIDSEDLEQLIVYVIKTYYGDANLDGVFNSSDITLAYSAAEYEDSTANNSSWEEGDWNGDGEFNSSDFVIAFPFYGQAARNDFSDPSIDVHFGFTARPFDDETGLQNNLHRWYDSKVGRWISKDPIGFAAGDANLYRYVGNKATMSIDPTGLVEPIEQDGEDWRLFYIGAFDKSAADYVVRKTGYGGTQSATSAAKNGIKPTGPKIKMHVIEHCLNQHGGGPTPYTSASSLPKGTPTIKGDPVWIDLNKLKGNEVHTFEDIVKSSDDFLKRNPHLEERFNMWKTAGEGEVLIQGEIPASAVSSRNMMRLKTAAKFGGKALFVYAVAADTHAFFAAEKKSRELSRIAGGWTGACIGGRSLGWAGAKGGGALALVLGQAGPQAAAPEEAATVPLLATIGGIGGGVIGGIGGYWGGGWAGGYYYDFITEGVERTAPK